MTEGTSESLSLPVLLVVDSDEKARQVTELALMRRFGTDYRVLTFDSGVKGIEVLRTLASQGEDVALMAADLQLPECQG